MANKALYTVVDKINQFEGNAITKYLRCHVKEMKLKHVLEKRMA